jgi:hypothetical protein
VQGSVTAEKNTTGTGQALGVDAEQVWLAQAVPPNETRSCVFNKELIRWYAQRVVRPLDYMCDLVVMQAVHG